MKKKYCYKTSHRLLGLALATSFALVNAQAQGTAADLDGDGIPNIIDPDIDNDGIPNALDKNIDGGIAQSGPYAGQFIGDHLDNNNPSDKDMDDDGLNDDSMGENDIDGDGFSDDNPLEDDTDGDGRRNDDPAEHDTDGDGRRDDDDNEDDTDGDGIDDRDDSDDDNDGRSDDSDDDHHPESEEMEVERYLTATAAAPSDGRAKVTVQQYLSGKLKFRVRMDKSEDGIYDLVIDGVIRGSVMVEDEEAELEYETNHNDEDEIELDFDVIGLPISLVKGGVEYHSGIVPTPAAGNGIGDQVDSWGASSISLTPAAGLSTEAAASAEVEFGAFGAIGLEIEVENIPVGDYEVSIGGVSRAIMSVALSDGRPEGRVEFDDEANDADELTLDFDAVGELVVISQNGVVFFSGVTASTPDGGTPGDTGNNGTQVGENETVLTAAPGLSPEASATAEVDFGLLGAIGLEIEVENIPVGDYDVSVGGMVRAVMSVLLVDGRPEGRVDFDAEVNSAGELPLDFAVAGEAVEISQGGLVFFSGTAASAASN